MEYKDKLGNDVEAGDWVVYAVDKSGLQVGKVTRLKTTKLAWVAGKQGEGPTLGVKSATKGWRGWRLGNKGREVTIGLANVISISPLDVPDEVRQMIDPKTNPQVSYETEGGLNTDWPDDIDGDSNY